MAKKTLGRRKIKMEKIGKKTSLQVAFSKRRKGLFKKAAELSVLCGAQVAVIVMSPSGKKVYSFAHPSMDAVINPFLKGDAPSSSSSPDPPLISNWWNVPLEDLKGEELEEYLRALETLADNVSKKANELETQAAASSSTNSSTICQLQDDNLCFDVDEFLKLISAPDN